MKSKLEQLKCNLLNNDSDIIALTETWLNDSVMTSEFCDTKIVFRKDRDQILTGKKQGGGVLLAIDSKFDAQEYKIFDNGLEAICVRIGLGKNKNRCLYVVVVYFVPGSSVELYDCFYNCVEIKLRECHCIILGDFNLPDYNADACSVNVCNLKKILAFTGLDQINGVKNANGVLLDLVLVSPLIQDCSVVVDDDPF